MEDERTPENEPGGRRRLLGVGVAIGAGVGAVLFAISGNPVWIGVMAGAGVAVGAALDSDRS